MYKTILPKSSFSPFLFTVILANSSIVQNASISDDSTCTNKVIKNNNKASERYKQELIEAQKIDNIQFKFIYESILWQCLPDGIQFQDNAMGP